MNEILPTLLTSERPLIGKVRYGFGTGPYLRQPFWKSYSEFVQLRTNLLKEFPNIQIIELPKKAPPYTKTKWSKKRITKRSDGLKMFLEYCFGHPDLKQSKQFSKFTNPLLLATRCFYNCPYETTNVLSSGSFGNIVEGITKTDREERIAVKNFTLPFKHDVILTKEIPIQFKLNHPNCLKLLGYNFCDKSGCQLILELAEDGSLLQKIPKNGFTEPEAQKWFYQFMLGVYYLHFNCIVHRDLKSENLLISNGQLKISDFGFSNRQSKNGSLTAKCGTPYYVAPEVFEPKYDGYCLDIWSCGVTLFDFLAGDRPFHQSTTSSFSKPSLDLLRRMLHKEPKKRLTAKECLTHKWLSSLYKEEDIAEIENSQQLHFDTDEEIDALGNEPNP